VDLEPNLGIDSLHPALSRVLKVVDDVPRREKIAPGMIQSCLMSAFAVEPKESQSILSIRGSIKRLLIVAVVWILVMSPPMIYAGHHPRPGARQLTDGSGSPFFIILLVVAIVGFFWWMTRKK